LRNYIIDVQVYVVFGRSFRSFPKRHLEITSKYGARFWKAKNSGKPIRAKPADEAQKAVDKLMIWNKL
jgi:hypothetical protein